MAYAAPTLTHHLSNHLLPTTLPHHHPAPAPGLLAIPQTCQAGPPQCLCTCYSPPRNVSSLIYLLPVSYLFSNVTFPEEPSLAPYLKDHLFPTSISGAVCSPLLLDLSSHIYHHPTIYILLSGLFIMCSPSSTTCNFHKARDFTPFCSMLHLLPPEHV